MIQKIISFFKGLWDSVMDFLAKVVVFIHSAIQWLVFPRWYNISSSILLFLMLVQISPLWVAWILLGVGLFTFLVKNGNAIYKWLNKK